MMFASQHHLYQITIFAFFVFRTKQFAYEQPQNKLNCFWENRMFYEFIKIYIYFFTIFSNPLLINSNLLCRSFTIMLLKTFMNIATTPILLILLLFICQANLTSIRKAKNRELDSPSVLGQLRDQRKYNGLVYSRKRKPVQGQQEMKSLRKRTDQSTSRKESLRKNLPKVAYEEMYDTPSESESERDRVTKKRKPNGVPPSTPHQSTQQQEIQHHPTTPSQTPPLNKEDEARKRKSALWYKWYVKQKEARKTGNPLEKAKAEKYFKNRAEGSKIRSKAKRERQSQVNLDPVVTQEPQPPQRQQQSDQKRSKSMRMAKDPYIYYN